MTLAPSQDPRTTTALFAAAMAGDYGDEATWKAVEALRLRGTMEVFDQAAAYCRSENPKERARGLDVLGQLGEGKPADERPYLSQCVAIARELLDDADARVVYSAAWALAYLSTEEAVEALLRLQQHPTPGVRHAVAVGVASHKGSGPVEALIGLMADQDKIVRDWAAFGLGSVSSEDSPKIREALHQRLGDPYEPARSEAAWGLARRKDSTGLRLLRQRLESEGRQQGDEHTAREILGLEEGASVEDLLAGVRKLQES